MRNLKKVLSLVLAVAMMVSICVVGAGAVNYDDFSDENEITKKQAVETLVSLDILNGYNGGETFAPKQNVTRAEMATIICRVLAGGDNLVVDATKEVPTYTDIDDNWAESYIEYCTSLGIVSGKGNGIFDPNADVTAAEAAKMVMTMLGYNADIESFKGSGWDINTMAKANTLKLTENLTGEISASVPVTREQVAQLIFNALDTPTVQNYNGTTANLWIGSGANAYQETLLETKFNAEKITGVVIANEFADLYGETPLKAGSTEVQVLGTDNQLTNTTYTVDLSTGFAELGTSVVIYRDKSSQRVIFGDYQDSELNSVEEFTAAGDITSAKAFDNAVSSKDVKNAEFFVNYSQNNKTTSDYKITYVIDLAAYNKANGTTLVAKDISDTATTDANGLTRVVIKANDPLSDLDLKLIKAIFKSADKQGDDVELGEVYVGTKTGSDISDELSFKQFESKYLNDEENVYELSDLNPNENGYYVRTVDYNNDGDIDYVFQITFDLDQIAKVSKTGDVTLVSGYTSIDARATSEYQNVDDVVYVDSDFVSDYEPVANDVVLTTIIDRVAYVFPADVTTATVKTVTYKNETITTTDGDTYGQSAVDNHTGLGDEIVELNEKTQYKLYFDAFGFVAAYEAVEDANVYGLLTEAYITKANNTAYIQSTTGIVELTTMDTNTAEYTVSNLGTTTNKDVNVFFKNITTTNSNLLYKAIAGLGVKTVNANDTFKWNNKEADSNVARYVLNDDGTVTVTTAAVQATNKSGKLLYIDPTNPIKKITAAEYTGSVSDLTPSMKEDYVQLAIPTANITTSTRSYAISDGGTLNVVHDTEFYLVNTTTKSVSTFTDYASLPKTIGSDKISAIYAVAENTSADQNLADYWVANVVVIEYSGDNDSFSSVSLAYYNPFKTVGEVKYLDTLNSKSEDPAIEIVPAKETWNGQFTTLGFYRLYDTTTENGVITVPKMDIVTSNYAGSYIYGATVDRYNEVTTRGGYVVVDYNADSKVDANGAKVANLKNLVVTTDTPVYTVTENAKTGVVTATLGDYTDLKTGDPIIYVCTGTGSGTNITNVAYIVNLADAKTPTWLTADYTVMVGEQTKQTTSSTTTSDLKVTFTTTGANLTADAKAELDKLTTTVKSGNNYTFDLTDFRNEGYTVSKIDVTGTYQKEANATSVNLESADNGLFSLSAVKYMIQNVTSDVTVTLTVAGNAGNTIGYANDPDDTTGPALSIKVGTAAAAAVATDAATKGTTNTADVGDTVVLTYTTKEPTGKEYTMAIADATGADVAFTTGTDAAGNGTVTFTMPNSNVTVTSVIATQTYAVSDDGNVTYAAGVTTGKATDNTQVDFTITAPAGKKVNTASTTTNAVKGVVVTVGGKELTATDLTEDGNGKYTIAATAVTGDIVITPEYVDDAYVVTFGITNGGTVYYTADKTVIADQDTTADAQKMTDTVAFTVIDNNGSPSVSASNKAKVTLDLANSDTANGVYAYTVTNFTNATTITIA
jgi:hypothetical protein